MAAKALAYTGGACIQESSFHGARQPSKKSNNISFIPYTNDMPNVSLSKETATTSRSRKLPEKKRSSSLSICADRLTRDDETTIPLTPDKLHQWITESITEIVRHIREAPFLYYIFEKNVSSTTPRRQRVPHDIFKEADSWPVLRNSLRSILPDGVILVRKLDEDSVCEYANPSECGKSSELQEFDKPGCTNIWGLLVQGRGVGVSACYILKTTEVISSQGCCTQFCLTKAKCFGASPRCQFIQSWLL